MIRLSYLTAGMKPQLEDRPPFGHWRTESLLRSGCSVPVLGSLQCGAGLFPEWPFHLRELLQGARLADAGEIWAADPALWALHYGSSVCRTRIEHLHPGFQIGDGPVRRLAS